MSGVNSRLEEQLRLDEQYACGIGKIQVNATLSLLAMARKERWDDLRRIVRLAAWSGADGKR